MAVKMVFDTNNLLFRVAAVNMGKTFGTPEEQAGLALHTAFQSVHKYYKRFKPDQWALTFEGRDNWRKTHTKSADAVAGNVYKANRVKDASMVPFFELLESFREVMTEHSSAVILSNDVLEGDDSFSAYVQKNTEEGHTVIGVSGDRDFVQLYKCPGFMLINPDTGKERNQPGDKDYEEDLDYWTFLKCVRGDKGDHVFSAFPRVREDKIKNTWDIKDENGNVIKTHRVGDLFEENKLLMDLFHQPEHIKEIMREMVIQAEANINSYSNFHFLRFLGKHKLNHIAEHIDQYTDMLSANTRFKRSQEALARGEVVPTPVEETKPKKKVLIEF
jgi:hypothetical protein